MSNTASSNARRDRSAWEQLMAQYEAADLSQRVFCEQHGLAYSTLGYWRKQYCNCCLIPRRRTLPDGRLCFTMARNALRAFSR